MVRHLLGHPRAADLDLDPDELLARFVDLDPRWRHLFRVALDLHAHERGARTAVEKTPAHLAHVPRILQWYPGARVVCVVRDGRDAVMSMLSAGFTHGDLRRHACNWRQMARLGEEYAARYPRQLHTVRFERLVTRPEQTLRRLHDFLHVPFDPRQLDGDQPTGVIPAWEDGWKGRARAAIDPTRAGAWRRTATPHQRCSIHAVMGDWLTRLDYEDATLDACPPAIRLREQVLARLWRAALHPAMRPVTATAWRQVRARIRRRAAPL